MGMLMHRHQEVHHPNDDSNITKLKDVQPFNVDGVMMGETTDLETNTEQEVEPKRRGRPRGGN